MEDINFEMLQAFIAYNPWSNSLVPTNLLAGQVGVVQGKPYDGFFFTSLGKFLGVLGNTAKVGATGNETVYVIIEKEEDPLLYDDNAIDAWFEKYFVEPIELHQKYKYNKLREIAAIAYGESSDWVNNKEEKYAIATARIRDMNQRSDAQKDSKPESPYNIFMNKYQPGIKKNIPDDLSMRFSLAAAINGALIDMGIINNDYSNGASFWQGRDFLIKNANSGHVENKGLYVDPVNFHYWEEYCNRVESGWLKKHPTKDKEYWRKNVFQERKLEPNPQKAGYELVISHGHSIFLIKGKNW